MVNRYLPDFLGGLPGEQVTGLLEELTDEALRPGSPVGTVLLTAPEMVPVPQAYRRADGLSLWRRHGAEIYTTRAMLDTETRLWRTDGLTAFQNVEAIHPAWVMADHWGFYHCLTRDRGITYGFAVNVEGVGVNAETSHRTVTTQCYGANTSNGIPYAKRWDWLRQANTDWHYAWGRNRDFNFQSGPEPTTFYTY